MAEPMDKTLGHQILLREREEKMKDLEKRTKASTELVISHAKKAVTRKFEINCPADVLKPKDGRAWTVFQQVLKIEDLAIEYTEHDECAPDGGARFKIGVYHVSVICA
jgi:hypothetical protein